MTLEIRFGFRSGKWKFLDGTVKVTGPEDSLDPGDSSRLDPDAEHKRYIRAMFGEESFSEQKAAAKKPVQRPGDAHTQGTRRTCQQREFQLRWEADRQRQR